MAKPPQGQGVKGKLKHFLGIRKSTGIAGTGNEEREVGDIIFTEDVLKEISRENTPVHRARALNQLSEVVMARKLEDHAVEALWHTIDDLLHPSVPAEARQAALKFLTALATGQFERLGILRAQFFRLVVNHHIPEDLSYRVGLLSVLTDNGKDISYCEQIGSFLVDFMEDALAVEQTQDFLLLLINIVHYNSSFLDKEVITIIVKHTCQFCNKARNEPEIENCLRLLDATVRYGGLPSEGLYPLIVTLCRTVNIERFCQQSWKLMRSLVGTRLGHSAIYIMCCILEDDNNILDVILLRGAVFFVGMCIWGSRRVATLRHAPISVLPSFKMCLQCNHPLVAHEISLSLQRLVKKYGQEQEVVTWDIIMDILEQLLKLLEHCTGAETDSLDSHVHSILSNIETLYCDGKFEGYHERFFEIIEKWSHKQPETSVKILLDYLHQNMIDPCRDDWLLRLQTVLERYFRNEKRSSVRIKALDIVSTTYNSYRYWYQDELLELVVNNYLAGIATERDYHVRLVAAQLLVDFLMTCTTKKCIDILDCLDKLICRCMDTSVGERNDEYQAESSEDMQDIEVAVTGLIKAFKMKLFCTPPVHAIQIYTILSNHVIKHYMFGCDSIIAGKIRREVFELLLAFRADRHHRIGVMDGDESVKIKHTVYLVCKAGYEEDIDLSHLKGITVKECTFARGFNAILAGLKDEWDWAVLEYLLLNLCKLLQNKALILGGHCDISMLCALLCKMINDRMFLNKIRNCPTRIGVSEFHNLIFPILGVVATYHSYIDRPRQYELVKSLELGLNTQCARTCVICLTVCILEMQHVLLRTLPPILVKLSQISATVPMSIPVLEFLSRYNSAYFRLVHNNCSLHCDDRAVVCVKDPCLKEIPDLYQNFVEEQYMSVFAMALPYTDSYKYSAYTVTLAHYVITAWFTRCRLPFRKGFVRLITKGLKSSSLMFFDRLKSQKGDAKSNANINQVKDFHEEMGDLCLDMMTRYSFSLCCAQPNRTPVIDFLLSKGPTQSWMVGNSVVTITTSAGSEQDCAQCQQQRVKRLASRAAARLGYSRRNSEKDTISIGSGNTSSISKEVEANYAIIEKPLSLSSMLKEVSQTSEAAPSPTQKPPPSPRKVTEVDWAANSPLTSPLKKKGSFSEKVKQTISSVPLMPSADADSTLLKPVLDRVRHSASNQSIKSATSIRSSQGDNEEHVTPLVEELTKRLVREQSQQIVFSPSEELLFSRQASKSENYDRQSIMTDEDSEVEDILSNVNSKNGSTGRSVTSRGSIRSPDCIQPIQVSVEPEREKRRVTDSPLARLLSLGKQVTPELKDEDDDIPPPSNGKDVTDDLPRAAALPVDVKVSPTKSPMKVSDSQVHEPSMMSVKRNIMEEMVDSSGAVLENQVPPVMCNCHCSGWAEILIRRPTGNVSWIMKLENEEKFDIPSINDLSLLVSSLDDRDARDRLGSLVGPIESGRNRALSSITDEMSMDRQSSRAKFESKGDDAEGSLRNRHGNSNPGSDSSRASIRKRSDTGSSRRRYSTGSVDLPGSFKYDSPSPDTLPHGRTGSDSRHREFETPCVGVSPAAGQLSASPAEEEVEQSAAQTDIIVDQEGPDDVIEEAKDVVPERRASSPMDISENISLRDHGKSPSRSPVARSQSGPSVMKAADIDVGDRQNLVSMHEHFRSSPVVSVLKAPQSAPQSPEKAKRSDEAPPPRSLRKTSAAMSIPAQNNLSLRPRVKTMSDLPSRRVSGSAERDRREHSGDQACKGYVNPYFVFLQFFYSPQGGFCGEKPIILERSEVIERGIKMLDRLPSFDTHKFGVLYVGKLQEENEHAILSNEYGSSRYMEFLAGLGSLIKLTECSRTEIYTGGLDRNGADGKFAYFWKDDTTQVIFHIATLMPNKSSDPACNSKKLHIGNDFVTIVYDDSSQGYKFGTIKGQFNFAEVVIRPLDYSSNIVTVRLRQDFKDMVINAGPHVISDKNLPVLVRQLAMHTNMATVIDYSSKRPADAFGSNWLERLRQIKRIKSKALIELHGPVGASAAHKGSHSVSSSSSCNDFTDFT